MDAAGQSEVHAPDPSAPAPLERWVQRLLRRHTGRITGHAIQPAQPADRVPMPVGLDPRLVTALASRGIRELYRHQAEAYALASAGQHLVLATPTASGKSLCFHLPVLDAALKRQRKALYLFPTKALAQDQVAELLALAEAGPLPVRAHTFDGDTPADARAAVRTRGDIVVSNPDMLHQAILPHHTKWAQFLGALDYVVIDELHGYRGVFGSHVANVLRRLKRILAFYGAKPAFILCSATIGNPREHAEALLGEPVTLLDRSGAPRGPRTVLLWNPPIVNPQLGLRGSTTREASMLARSALKARLKTLVFAQSRLTVEVLTKYLKDVFDRDPRKPPRIRGYRGGYLPSERRTTEKQMRAGEVDGIVSTSALELGVDIGMLDVVVLSGYPGSVAASWQRLGRAGRRQQPSVGIVVAGSQGLDQYVIRHPELFFGASPEHARIAPDQLLILYDHLRCAAFELPFSEGECYGGAPRPEFLELLAERGLLHQSAGRWTWIADSYPAASVSLRSVADGNFVVIDQTGGAQTIIAEVDYSSAALTLYEGAIYMVQSTPYQVEKLDWPGRKAYVVRTRADYYTDAIDYTRLKPLSCFDGVIAGEGSCRHGEVHVVRRVAGYKKIRFYSHENIGYGPVSLPDQELQTSALWWQLPAALMDRVFPDRQDALDGLLGAAEALHTVALLRAMAERHDVCVAVGSEEAGPPQSLANRIDPMQPYTPTIYLYDNYPGGMGFSEPLWRQQRELVRAAAELIAACGCAAGCPACVGAEVAAGPAEGAPTAPRLPKRHAVRLLGLLGAGVPLP